jgi:phenylacetate-CoA ligase
MNKHFLKGIRDEMPEFLKYVAAPFFRAKLIKNREFCKYYDLLEGRETINHEKIKEYQLSQTKELLVYSYQNVPYYTELFNKIKFDPEKLNSFDDIKVIPYLTKQIIRQNFDKLISTKKVNGGYYIATTGGTTGEPLKVLLDYDSIFQENAFIYQFRKRLGYQFEDKLATFRGVEFGGKLWKLSPMYNELLFSPFKLSKLTLNHYVKKINSFNAKYLNGYLSSLYFFAKLMEENQIRLSVKLKGIFLLGENIDVSQRQFLENFFSVKSSTHYGQTERCVIAEELERGLYKPNPFYGYTELIKQSSDDYEIVSSGFLHRTMPLIRYKSGDLCEKANGLIKIKGRWNVTDFLVGINDEKVSHISINFHSDILKNVSNYQFIQDEKGKAELLLIVNKDFNPSEITVMRTEMDRKIKGVIDFNIKVVDSLKLSSGGKFNRFISNIKND